MIKTVLKDLTKFVISPNTDALHFENQRYLIPKKVLLTLALGILSIIVGLSLSFGINGILTLLGFESPQNLSNKKELLESLSPLTIFLLAAVLAPIVEETAFRLPLLFRKTYLSLSATFLYLLLNLPQSKIILGELTTSQILTHVGIGVGIFAMSYGLLSIDKVADSLLRFGKKNFAILFYTYAIFFAVIHFKADQMTVYSFTATIPQLVGAIVMGYIRIKLGFQYAVLKHFFNNAPVALLYV